MISKFRGKMESRPNNRGIPLRILVLPIIVLVVFRLVLLFISSENNYMDAFNSLLISADVSAQEKSKNPLKDKTNFEDAEGESSGETGVLSIGQWSPDFIDDIKSREEEMKRKKATLEIQEQNLIKLKNQIEERIEQLIRIEKNISAIIEKKVYVESDRIKKLAKVFESTPPEQAGILMSKLDIEIASKLLINMNGRKAGKIWGFVNPDKAVLITNKLSEISPNFKIENQK